MSKELIRVEREASGCHVLWIGDVQVRRWRPGNPKVSPWQLAAAIEKEMQKEFQIRARNVANESKYREVKHY